MQGKFSLFVSLCIKMYFIVLVVVMSNTVILKHKLIEVNWELPHSDIKRNFIMVISDLKLVD